MEDKKAIEELERRVNTLEHEAYQLKRMIMALKSGPTLSESEHVKPTNLKKTNPAKTKKIIQKEPVDWEKRIGQVWLPRIFIFVLLIGVIWAFKAVSNYGLLNEPVKVIIGYVAGAALLYLGQKQIQKSRVVLGQVLLGGGVVLLLIVTFAMHVLYGLVPTILAVLLNILWIGLGIYFSHRYQSQPLAVLTGIGGYLIPFLIESANPSIMNFVAFETIFYLTLLIFAMRKKFFILYHVAFALLHVTFLAGALLLSHGDTEIFAIAAGLQHLFLLITLFTNHSFVKQQIGILFTSFILLAAWLSGSYPDNQFEWMMLGIFAIYAVLSIGLWNKNKKLLAGTLSISSLAFMLFLANKFEIRDISGLLIVQGVMSVHLGMIATSKLKQGVGIFIYVIGVAVTIFNPFVDFLTIDFANWVVLIASLFALSMVLSFSQSLKESDRKSLKLIVHFFRLIFIFYFVTLIANAATLEQTSSIQFMTMSFSWALYAFACLIVGAKKDDKILRVFALILLFLTLAKLVFIDLSYLLLSIRALLFIVLGIIGIVISRIYYKSPQ